MFGPFDSFPRQPFLGYQQQLPPVPPPLMFPLLEAPDSAPISIAAAFDTFVHRIELNPDRVKEASQHYRTIKDWIESRLPGTLVKQVGSFQRNSKIRPVSVIRLFPLLSSSDDYTAIDMDAIVCFGNATTWVPSHQGTMPTDVLALVRRALNSHGTYKLMEPTVDSPTVVLSYANEFKIELIPCFRDWTSLDAMQLSPPRYLVASEFGGWKLADYDYDAQYITNVNRRLSGRLVPGIKVVKAFVRNRALPIKSFHIEIICATAVADILQALELRYLTWDYRHFLVAFLIALPGAVQGPIALPGSYSPPQQVHPADMEPFLSAVNLYADAGLKLCGFPDSRETLDAWRLLVGHPFPSAEQ